MKDGRIEQENFNTYQVLRMNEMPAVETIVMPSGGFWGGVGEPTIAVAAPAVLNAIFAATGKRIRDLPLKNHSLKRAWSKAHAHFRRLATISALWLLHLEADAASTGCHRYTSHH